ncbi:hypothetical protein HOD61_00995 [archaeon]|jgi:hypothetical protein|nr:hypothetical protein [archaeon]
MDGALIVGLIGMLIILTAFVLNLLKIVTQDEIIYSVMNIIGSLLLAVYSYNLNSIPFLALQSVWISFAVYKIIIIMRN